MYYSFLLGEPHCFIDKALYDLHSLWFWEILELEQKLFRLEFEKEQSTAQFLVFSCVALISAMAKSNLDKERVYVAYASQVYHWRWWQDRSWSRNHVEECCLLACSPTPAQLSFCTAQHSLPSNSTTHSGLGPTTWIFRQENSLQAYPQASLFEAVPQLSFP